MKQKILVFLCSIAVGAIFASVSIFLQRVTGSQGIIFWVGGGGAWLIVFWLYSRFTPPNHSLTAVVGAVIGASAAQIFMGIPLLPSWL